MTPTMNRNGQQRKSLAGQIDRLDAILDGLSDGLNEAVADVVKEAVGVAVQEAVRAVLSEVLQNADLRSQLFQAQPAQPTAAPPRPRCRWLRAVCQFVRRVLSTCQGAIAGAAHSVVQRTGDGMDYVAQRGRRIGAACRRQAAAGLTGCGQLWRLACSFPGPLLTAVFVGMVTGFVVYHTGPWVGGVVSGLAGFALSGMLQLGIRLRSFLPMLTAWSH